MSLVESDSLLTLGLLLAKEHNKKYTSNLLKYCAKH